MNYLNIDNKNYSFGRMFHLTYGGIKGRVVSLMIDDDINSLMNESNSLCEARMLGSSLTRQ